MDTEKAKTIIGQIRKICLDNGLFFSVKEEYRPLLKTIKIEEISIRIEPDVK